MQSQEAQDLIDESIRERIFTEYDMEETNKKVWENIQGDIENE